MLTLVIVSGLTGVEDVPFSLLGAWIPTLVGFISLNISWSSLAIGMLTDFIDAGRFVTIWTKMNAFLARAVFCIDLISMTEVFVSPLIVVLLQFCLAGQYYAMQRGAIVSSGSTSDLSQSVVDQFLSV